MRDVKWILLFCTIVVLLLGSTRIVVTQEPVIKKTDVSATGTINTTNCNGDGGLCQPTTGPSPCNGGAGANPDKIQASVYLCEYSGTLKARGSGTGFRYGRTYLSLIYLNGNPATCSRFPDNVLPTLQNAANPVSGVDNDFASMMLGFWTVKPDGSATLTVNKQATLLGLDKYGSISVREVQPPNQECYNVQNDPAPQLNALRACGGLTIGGRCGSDPDPCEALPDLCDLDPCGTNPQLCE